MHTARVPRACDRVIARGGEGVGTVGAQVADGSLEHVVCWRRRLARHADPLVRAREHGRTRLYSLLFAQTHDLYTFIFVPEVST